jgi:hypothetical protein
MMSNSSYTEGFRILGEKTVMINVGLEAFAESLKQQNIEVVSVRWRPPRKNPADIEDLLKKML